MSDTKILLKDYKEVLQELEKTKPNNHLLLGNGFNMSLGIKTDYASILKQMEKNNGDYKAVFPEKFKNFDLEDFIGTCKGLISDKDDKNNYSEFMKTYFHNKVKLDFIKATSELVAQNVKGVYQEENDAIYLLLKQFDNYFTLNFDPFLYQLLMLCKKNDDKEIISFQLTFSGIKNQMDEDSLKLLNEIEKAYKSGVVTIDFDGNPTEVKLEKLKKTSFTQQMKLYYKNKNYTGNLTKVIDEFWKNKEKKEQRFVEKCNDGFGLFGDQYSYKNYKKQNLFFLHGAFHLYNKDELICKITAKNGSALYEQFEEVVENADENMLCIFSDKNKKNEIMENEYLKNGFNKLSKLEGTLVIIGSSLAENDEHIFNEIAESKLNKIYISSCENDQKKDLKRATELFPEQEIVLFDRTTISYAK